MGEEAFDEVIIPCEDGMVLHVTGGYGREEVCLGIGRPTEEDRKARRMTRVVGFEGVLADDDVISYGAAAIDRDGMIVNSLTGIGQFRADLDEKVEALTLFAKPWDVAHAVDDAELIVVAIQVKDHWSQELVPAGGFGGFLGKKRAKPNIFLLFRDRLAFRQYAEETAARVADTILREQCEGVAAYSLLQSALVLTPRDPMLLALRVHLTADKTAAKRTADRLLEEDLLRPARVLVHERHQGARTAAAGAEHRRGQGGEEERAGRSPRRAGGQVMERQIEFYEHLAAEPPVHRHGGWKVEER